LVKLISARIKLMDGVTGLKKNAFEASANRIFFLLNKWGDNPILFIRQGKPLAQAHYDTE